MNKKTLTVEAVLYGRKNPISLLQEIIQKKFPYGGVGLPKYEMSQHGPPWKARCYFNNNIVKVIRFNSRHNFMELASKSIKLCHCKS